MNSNNILIINIKIFVILFIMSITMTYYSPYNYIVAVASISILFMSSIQNKFNLKSILLILFIFILLFYDGIRVFTSIHEYEIERIVIFYLSFCVFIFTLIFFKNNSNFKIISKAIEIILWIHLIIWFIQFLGLYAFNYQLDILQLITEKASRAYPKIISGITLHRPTGLSNEPGGYAIDTVVLLYASYIIRGKLTRLHILTVLSYFLSLTLFGMIFGFFLILLHITKGIKKIKSYHIFIFIFILIPVFVLFSLYIGFRLEDGNNGSLLMKLQPIMWLYEQDIYRILLGSGFGINDFGGLVADTSIYFNLFFTFGVFGILFYFILMFLLRKSFIHKALLSIFFLGKTKLYFMSFWFFLAMLFLTYYKKIGYKK